MVFEISRYKTFYELINYLDKKIMTNKNYPVTEILLLAQNLIKKLFELNYN